jgi:hypothetical protein
MHARVCAQSLAGKCACVFIESHLHFFVTVLEHFSGGEQFGQRRPPLSTIIRQILERYPDGQLFKVVHVVHAYAC